MARIASILPWLHILLSVICTNLACGKEAVSEALPSSCSQSSSPFTVIIDGGSTGSRLHVFEFVSVIDEDADDVSGTPICKCLRRGTDRANVPMSSFALDDVNAKMNATHIADHMLPLFEYAATTIPLTYHDTTTVLYQATAGMRLVTPKQEKDIYDALFQGLMESDRFAFKKSFERSNIQTLSGELEAYYGVVAANYLQGIIDVTLSVVNEEKTSATSSSPAVPFVGALDMGGSSTQIVYFSSDKEEEEEDSMGTGQLESNDMQMETEKDDQCCHISGYKRVNQTSIISSKLNEKDFFSTSYLSYGVDQIRERLWTTWIHEHNNKVKRHSAEYDQACDAGFIPNPCGFRGHVSEWMGHTLLGTGDTHECEQQIKRLIPHHEDVVDHHLQLAGEDEINSSVLPFGTMVGGIQHPPIRGKFFGMSLYFFALDSLRILSHNEQAGDNSKDHHEVLNLSWPTPSVEELHNALDGLCSRDWEKDLYTIRHNAHKFTRAEILHHRCFETVYIVTLLKDGFGFHPSSRDITFTFDVDGSEVEWTLGMALANYSSEGKDVSDNDEASVQEKGVVDSSKRNTSKVLATDDGETNSHEFQSFEHVFPTSQHLVSTTIS